MVATNAKRRSHILVCGGWDAIGNRGLLVEGIAEWRHGDDVYYVQLMRQLRDVEYAYARIQRINVVTFLVVVELFESV